MMKLNPHLTFNGQCEAAFRFYEQCLGGTIEMMMTYGASPAAEQVAPAWREKIIHATFNLDGDVLTGADAPPERYQEPAGFSLTLGMQNATEAERIFAILAENGVVQFALQETFWAARFGMLVDQFGTPWMINCRKAVM